MCQGLEHKPTEKTKLLVAARKAQGHTNEQIAAFFDISADTLAKHYDYEIRNGRVLFMDEVHEALRRRIAEGSDALIKTCLTHRPDPNGWRSADKVAEVDANKELAAAIAQKKETDELTLQLRGHLKADAQLSGETSTDERD